jgi:hypothetical protein
LCIHSGEAREPKYLRLPDELVFAPGPHDLGACMVEPSHLMAAGTVVDGSGTTVEGAIVHVVRPVSITDPANSVAWTPDPNLSASGGTFTLASSISPASFFVQAFAPGHLPSPPMRVKHGARDLRLEVTPFGWIEWDVKLEAVVARGHLPLVVSMNPVGSPGDPPHARVWETAKAGVRRSAGLPPGRWDVSAEWFGFHQEQKFQVDVHAGRAGATIELDFRGKIPFRRLDVVGPAGARMATKPLVLTSPICKAGVVSGAPDSMFALLGHAAFDEVVVVADGYRLKRLGRVDRDQTAVLEPGLPVALALSKTVELPPAPWKLAFRLELLNGVRVDDHHVGLDGFDWNETFELDASASVRLTLPASGTYMVRWVLVKDDFRRLLAPRKIQIQDQNDLQRIVIEPEPVQYAELVEQLTGQ